MSLIESAKQILLTLNNMGFYAYFVGGYVRDMVLGVSSDEIDIATNASPTIITTLFPKTISVGAAFGVIIVIHNEIPFEVSTFREDLDYTDGRHPSSIKFSSMKQDAFRRDFTINGMFYDPFNDQIFDYVGGLGDIKNKVIRAIGVPQTRFQEDRLRMLRCARFSARFQFQIEPNTEKALIRESSNLKHSVSVERIWQELQKMCSHSHSEVAIRLLYKFNILKMIFPAIKTLTKHEIILQTRFIQNLEHTNIPSIILISLCVLRNVDAKTQLESFARLKVSNKDLRILATWLDVYPELAENKKHNNVFWVTLLSMHEADLFIDIRASLFTSNDDKLIFLDRINTVKQKLSTHIIRLINRKPLISAIDLIQKGIAPGKLLGDLLKEAEYIAITKNLNDKAVILSELERSHKNIFDKSQKSTPFTN